MASSEHFLLFSLLFGSFLLILCKSQHKIDRKFWLTLLFPIVVYVFVTGLRYGWGSDYFLYKIRIENPFDYIYEDPVFAAFNSALNKIGLNFAGVYVVYSLVFIFGAFLLIKDFKGENKYMLTLFLPATLLKNTYMIRQAIGIALVYIALHFFVKQTKLGWFFFILFSVIAYFTHPFSIFILAMILLFYYLYDKPIPCKYSIVLYLLLDIGASFFVGYFTSFVQKIMPYLTFNDKLNLYTASMDQWFSMAGADRERFEQGFFAQVYSSLAHISLLYIGFIALTKKKNRFVCGMYNTVVIGLLMLRPFYLIEILRRVADSSIYYLYFIPAGYAISLFYQQKEMFSRREKFAFLLALYIIVSFLVLYWLRFLVYPPFVSRFVWD